MGKYKIKKEIMLNKILKSISLKNITKYRSEIALVLVLLVGIETPGKIPNIDYYPQLYSLAVAGLFSWIYLLTKDRKKLISYLKNYFVVAILLGLFLLSIFHHARLNFLGSYLFPNSILSTISLVGVGILVAGTELKRKVSIIYLGITLITLYSLISVGKYYFNSRFYGNFLQPDIFAEYITIAFVAGLQILNNIKNKKLFYLVFLNQLFLITVLYLTKTRAVFLIAILMNLLFIFLIDRDKRKYAQTTFLVILVGLFFFSPFRSNSAQNLSYSSTYRFHLQSVAIPHTKGSLIVGSGNDGLQNSILCGNFFKHKDLIRTCAEGFYFTSTHNIFLDKAMVFGLLSSASLVLLILIRIFKDIKNSSNFTKISGLILLSLFLYYFTNVTSLILESILFTLIF